MSKKTSWLAGAVSLVSLVISFSVWAIVYSAEEIEGWVVDAETNQPLEGVVVSANWKLTGGIMSGQPIGQLQILETVTDENGRYHFQKWGPKIALQGELREESPQILLFKPGFKFGWLMNDEYKRKGTNRSEWSGKTIKLQSARGDLQVISNDLSALPLSWLLPAPGWGGACDWEYLPTLLRTLDKQDQTLIKAGFGSRTVVASLRANEASLKAKGCKSIAGLLNEKN